MRHFIIAGAVLAVVLAAFAGPAVAQTLKGPVSDKPLDEKWAPSKWGANDRAGSANHTKNSANIAKALATIKQNKAITVGKYYHREAPAFGPRGWQLVIPGTPTGGPFGKNALVYHDELVITELGQISTQFDGPGHIGVNTSKGPQFYNGVISWDAYERGAGGRVLGMGPLGVEHVGELGFVCRLVVLDAVAYKKSKGLIPAGAEMLPIPKKAGDPGIVTADDVKAIVKMEGLAEIGSGDCVALHTGQGNTWSNDRYKSMNSEQRKAARDIFGQGEPGFGISACEYMASRDIALTMGDTSANDAQPAGEMGTDYAVHCHTEMMPRRGIWNLENVDTKSLVDHKIYEGAFIWAPLRMIGATGSPGNPVVLY
jgi:kynurenine formamidase